MFEYQYAAIKKRYGKRCANNANYGWAAGPDFVCTKVYGTSNGTVIMDTRFNGRASYVHTLNIDDEWVEY